MEQTEYTGNFVENLFASLKQLANSLSKIMQSGGTGGSGALSWFAANWLKLVLILIVVGIVVDWLVWMIRWRPYWLWFRKKRVLLDDEDDEDYDDDHRKPPRRQYHSTARPRRRPQREMYARPDGDDEYFEEDDPEMDAYFEEDYFDDDIDMEIDDIEIEDERDGFDELLKNALVTDDEEEEDPFADMSPKKPRSVPADTFEEEDDLFDVEGFDEEDQDEFFEFSEPITLQENPLIEYAKPEPEPTFETGESPWRTGYTVRVPKIDANSMELSRKMRRRLRAMQKEDNE